MGDRDYFQAGYDSAPRDSIGGGSFWATFRVTKIVIASLLGIHLALAIVNATGGRSAWLSVVRIFELQPDRVLDGWIWQLLTMGLIHASGVWHVLLNCVFVWIFGRMIEGRISTRQYLGFLAGATVLGSLFFVASAVLTGDQSAAIGASGFCMGMMVLAASWYPQMEIYLWGILRMRLWALAAAFVFIDLLQTLNGAGAVAYTAHLGGAAYGWIYFKYGRRIEGAVASVDKVVDKRQAKKQQKNTEQSHELRAEVDRILDKVNREGMQSLTAQERKFLKSASKKLG